MRTIIYLAVILFLSSCNNNEAITSDVKTDSTTVQAPAAKMEFSDVYSDFFYSIIDKRAETFDQYIHPEQGLYIIQSQGAIPEILNIKDISAFRTLGEEKSFFEFDLTKVGNQLMNDSLPKIDCDKAPSFYSKEGSFTQEINTLKDSKIWEAGDKSVTDKEQIKKAAEAVKMTVINTANYTYYFSEIDGKWYVTFIDMRKPCSA